MDFSVIFTEVVASETFITGMASLGTVFLGIVLCAVILPRDVILASEYKRDIHH